MITSLASNEIFVFGSNTRGKHYGGAAWQARIDFGAEMGVGEGRTGQCYAFPTLNGDFLQRTREQLEISRDKFYAYAKESPNLTFLMTPVGTGIANYSHNEMKSLFVNSPENIKLPKEWI